jgi:hypothetical protein
MLLAEKANKVQETWIAPTLLSGRVNYGAPFGSVGYYKDEFGNVKLKGVIKNGTATQYTDIFILPSGYRPPQSVIVVTNSFDAICTLYIKSNGEVEIQSGANAIWLNLDGILFKVGA